MKDRPLIISLLIGLIVILVIAGVSILAKMNSLSKEKDAKLSENMSLQRTVENLKDENTDLKNQNKSLKDEVGQLTSKVEELKTEITKIEKLKDKLEEALKDELMRKELEER